MGRRIPPYTNASIHPAVSFSLLTACVAATIVVIAALCGSKARCRAKHRKSSQLQSHSSAQNNTNIETMPTATKSPAPSPSPSPTMSTAFAVEAERNTPESQQSPPILTPEGNGTPKVLTVRTQRRRLSASLSMKMGGTALARLLSRKEEHQHLKQRQTKPEDSIWTKTIMLGERCKVPDEDDAIIYDERGNRLSAYPVRTPRSLPVSRSNSFIDKDSLPLQESCSGHPFLINHIPSKDM